MIANTFNIFNTPKLRLWVSYNVNLPFVVLSISSLKSCGTSKKKVFQIISILSAAFLQVFWSTLVFNYETVSHTSQTSHKNFLCLAHLISINRIRNAHTSFLSFIVVRSPNHRAGISLRYMHCGIIITSFLSAISQQHVARIGK